MARLHDRVRLASRRKGAFHSGCFLLSFSLTGAARPDKLHMRALLLTRVDFWMSLGAGMAALGQGGNK
jgi:hypothetical protein